MLTRILLLAVWSSTVAFSSAPSLAIPKLSAVPQLTDYSSTSGLRPGARVESFVQRLPNDGKPSVVNTTVYLSYDSANLYAAFVCEESADRIRAQLAKREDIGNDDLVSIYLDTYRDGSRAYVFSANPVSVQRDGLLLEGQKTDYSFDTIWDAKATRTNSGFVVLFSIPFRSLRFPAGPNQVWGIALQRYSIVNNEDSYWPSISNRVSGFIQQFATLEMGESIAPGRNIQLQPFLTGLAARELSGARYRKSAELNGGVDGKVVIADALTFDFTVRPDFSQVESDDPQVTVNQRYEVLFPEKRPFFLENSTYFNTPIPLFFSRRIVSPDYGARLTGKIGSWAIGALVTDDTAPRFNDPIGSPHDSAQANIGVFSLQRDFSNQTRIGFLASTRELDGSYNTTLSADMRVRLNSNWFLTGQFFRTETNTPHIAASGGNGAYASLERNGLHFDYLARYIDFGPKVRDDLGFIKRVDIRTGEQYFDYRWRPNRMWLLSYGPSADILINYDHSGRLQDAYGEFDFSFELPRQTELKIGHTQSYEYYLQGFRKSRTDISGFTSWKRWLFLYGSYGVGTDINYSTPYGVAPFLGEGVSAAATVAIRPSNRLKLDETYLHTRLRRGNESVFNNHLIRSKLNMQFTKELSLRFILDYNGLLPNTSLFNAGKFKRLTGDVLFTYLVQPGTAFYVGYTDRYDNLAFVAGDTPQVINSRYPNLSTGRQVFVKISHNWRF